MGIAEFIIKNNSLSCSLENEILELEAWGPNGIRVRGIQAGGIKQDCVSALIGKGEQQAVIEIDQVGASIQNGQLKAKVSNIGEVSFENVSTGKVLLREQPIHPLSIPARAYKALQGNLYHLDCCFEAYDDEKIYGLGQHQHGRLNQKGCVIELIQRNTEVTIPFLVSSQGYGFLWNNPAIGRVELGYSATRWVAEAATQIDYWVTTGNTPAAILSNYADVTGHAPEFPEWAAGFWQSKLRYASQAELESIAEEYHRRNLPLSVIVVDFFHWTRQGEWQFDPEYWPDPTGMVQRLEKLGVKVMVSVWPTVNRLSKNYREMYRKNFIIRNKLGSAAQMYFADNHDEAGIYMHYYDATHPQAREFLWEQVKKGYFQHGIKLYWLDACEPEMWPFMPENLRFEAGDGQAVANCYPLEHVRGFYDGMISEGEKAPLFLIRSAWAGSQRFGAAVWSGDIMCTFSSLQAQVRAGLNMAISGIPWWTTDIGGFRGGRNVDPNFQQLIVRWFQYGAFCPIFRLHGHRLPNPDDFHGAANEVWSFGEPAYRIIKEYLLLRERLRPYIMEQMTLTSKTGVPPMRPLFVDFPSDPVCFDIDDEYLFGSDILVAPILDADINERAVYLPNESVWRDVWTGQVYHGGQRITVEAPLERIPLFLRENSNLSIRTFLPNSPAAANPSVSDRMYR
jgi:alpha-D-xyloside xylohydrolase